MAKGWINRGRRRSALLCAGALLVGAATVAPAQAAPGSFDPVLTASLGTDAARASSSFSLRITQADGQEQIGPISLTLPRNPGFVLNTDVPGPANDRPQIGTIRVVLYTGTAPGRAPVTVDGTVHDDNGRSGCGGTSGRQCVVVRLDVPGIGAVEAQLEIYEDADGYRVAGDLTETWADPNVASIDARLAELSVTLVAKVGQHVVLTNAGPGVWSLRHDIRSASVPSRGLTGGLRPPCAPDCHVNLTTREYAPAAPVLVQPVGGGAQLLTPAPTSFTWLPSTDRNGDPVTYTLIVDGAEVATTSGTTGSAHLAPGRHSWQVRAMDDRGGTSLSAERHLTVIDPATAMTFTAVVSGDRLYVVPGAFVYRVPNNPYQLGAETTMATADRGAIVHSGGFTLAIAYDTATASADGYLNLGSLHRIFIDPPGA